MSRACLQCNKWQAARDDLCLLCRGLLGVVQVSKQENFTSSDFSFAVEQVNSLLGNLTARVVGVPGPRLSGGSSFRRDSSPHSHRGSTSYPAKEGTREPPPERPRSSQAARPAPRQNPKAPPASSEESEEETTRREKRHRRRESGRRRGSRAEASPSRERSRKRAKESTEDKEGDKLESPPKVWKPTLRLEGRKSAGVPEPSSPPRVELSARPSRDASEGSAPASHSPGGKGNSPREEREADPEGGPPEVVTGPVRNSSSHRGTWEWNPPTKGKKGKGPGPKGQGKKGKANFSWPAWGYWVPPRSGRGLRKRIEAWHVQIGGQPGTPRIKAKGKAKELRPRKAQPLLWLLLLRQPLPKRLLLQRQPLPLRLPQSVKRTTGTKATEP